MSTTLVYLTELRQRLIKCLLCLILIFFPLFYYAHPLFHYLAAPLLHQLKGPMIATNVTSPVFIPIELALKTALILGSPYLFYQVWAFIAPALYPRERGLSSKLLCASLVLFFLGLVFCYWVVLPMMFGFLLNYVPNGVKMMPDITYYMELTSQLFLLFGLSFQVPVIIFFLTRSNLVSLESLKNFRPYLIVSAFTVGMLLTPPDVLSQVLLALPICLLYEVGVLVSRGCVQKEKTPTNK